MKYIILFLVLVCPCFTSRVALGDDSMRYATQEDVVGTWKMVPFLHTPKTDKINFWPLPYQWFRFYKDGAVTSIMQSDAANFSANDLESMFESLKVHGPRYSWDDGIMIISNPDGGPKEIWEITIFKRDDEINGTHLLKGDILMTLQDSNGSIIYHRILRKLAK